MLTPSLRSLRHLARTVSLHYSEVSHAKFRFCAASAAEERACDDHSGGVCARRFSLPEPEARLFQVDSFSRLLGQCHWQAGKPRDTPVIAIVHGLEGSADSYYMQGIAEKAFHRGFHVVRLNQRNCGGTEKLTPTLYNSGMSGDYRAVFEELANVDGFERIFFAGYSMGGNLVTKMAGEYGDDFPQALRGVCAVCPALDLSACADALERGIIICTQRHFVKGLMARYARKGENVSGPVLAEWIRSDSNSSGI